jgi:hypothetical protein
MSAARFATIALFCAAAFVLSSSADAQKTRALVIGINAYPDIRVNGVGGARNLRGAANDAKNVKQALADHFEVKPGEI